MWLAVLAALAFLAGAISNVVAPPPDWPDAIAGLAIAAALIGVPLFYRRERTLDDRFIDWLRTNEQRVCDRGAWYRGVLITPEIRLTRYRAVFSILVVTYTLRSRFHLVGVDAGWRAAILHSAATVLCGWWAVPWGFVRPMEALSVNFNGGDTLTVLELFQTRPSTNALEAVAPMPPRDDLPSLIQGR